MNLSHDFNSWFRRAPCRHGVLLVLLSTIAAGCDFPGRPKADEQFVPPHGVKSFRVLFQQNCAGCHGTSGKLGAAPPLNDKLFLSLISNRELERIIARGRPEMLMPAFSEAAGGRLTAEQVTILARGIKKEWGPTEPARPGTPPYALEANWPTRALRETERGLAVFKRACASCHGAHGEGGRHRHEHGTHEVGAINDPDFLALISDQAVRRFVITGRPDLGMPGYADPMGRPDGFTPLSDADVSDVTALLSSWRRSALERKGD